MTNMPADPYPYWPFGITLVAICVPFFSLIGFLSTSFGYGIWATKTKQLYRWIAPRAKIKEEDGEDFKPSSMNRTSSTEEGMRLRMGDRRGERLAEQGRERGFSFREKKIEEESTTHPNIKRMVKTMGEGRQSGLVSMGTIVGSEGGGPRASKDNFFDVRDE
jgi:hypothetical protein